MNSLVRVHGLGGLCNVGAVAGRRAIEPSDIQFALESRPRMSWQNIAKIRGVNQHDLMAHCGALTPADAPKAPAPPPKPRATKLMRVLALTAEGFTQVQIAEAIGEHTGKVAQNQTILREKGLLEGYAASASLRVTEKGFSALKSAGLA